MADVKDLIALKVKIGTKDNGWADYPDWTKISFINDNADMRKYCPMGWMYDKKYGHNESGTGSPVGMQWGYLLVTETFATEAIKEFPTLVSKMTEAEFESAYEGNITAHLPENEVDNDVLQGLKTEYDIKTALAQDTTVIKAKMAKAIDPNDSELGIKKNKDKLFSDYKFKTGITIKKATIQ